MSPKGKQKAVSIDRLTADSVNDGKKRKAPARSPDPARSSRHVRRKRDVVATNSTTTLNEPVDSTHAGRHLSLLTSNDARHTTLDVAKKPAMTEDDGDHLDYHLNVLLEVDATKVLFQTAAKQVVDAIVPLATPLHDRFETVLEELQRRGADNEKLLAAQTGLRRALSLKWGTLMVHELEQDPDHLKVVIPKVISLVQKLFGPACTQGITKTLGINSESTANIQELQRSRSRSRGMSAPSDEEEPSANDAIDASVSGALNLPASSALRRVKELNRELRNALRKLPAETLDLERLKIRFPNVRLLFAYHAEPVIRKELGPEAKDLAIRRKISQTWKQLEEEQKREWKSSLRKLHAGDRVMLKLAPSEDRQGTVAPTTSGLNHREMEPATTSQSIQTPEPPLSQCAQSEPSIQSIKHEIVEQQLHVVPESSGMAATAYEDIHHTMSGQWSTDRVREQGTANPIMSLPACKLFRPPSDMRLLGAYEMLEQALISSPTPVLDFLWCREGIITQTPSNLREVVDRVVHELRYIAQHTEIRTQFLIEGEKKGRNYSFTPHDNKLRSLLLQAKSCPTSELARSALESHLENLVLGNPDTFSVFRRCEFMAPDRGRQRTLKVGRLSSEVTLDMINAEFRKYGIIKRIRMRWNPTPHPATGFALVIFETPHQAQEALAALNHSTFGGCRIRVQLASTR